MVTRCATHAAHQPCGCNVMKRGTQSQEPTRPDPSLELTRYGSRLARTLSLTEKQMTRWLLILISCLGLAARTSVGAPLPPIVSAELSPSAIVITNRSTQAVCYAIHESDLLTRIEWGPECSDANRIGSNKSVRVKTKPGDFEPSGEVVVSWWLQGKTVVENHIRLKAR